MLLFKMAAPIEENAIFQNNCNVDFYDHPKYKEMLRLGLSNHTQMCLALLTYLDLVENKGWWNVTVHAGQTEGVAVLLVGHESRRKGPEVILPMAGEIGMSVSRMKTIAQIGKKVVPNANSVITAIVDSDSSISYFRLAEGLLPPAPPDEIEAKVEKKKRQEQRKKQRFVHLRREAQSESLRPQNKQDPAAKYGNTENGETDNKHSLEEASSEEISKRLRCDESKEGTVTQNTTEDLDGIPPSSQNELETSSNQIKADKTETTESSTTSNHTSYHNSTQNGDPGTSNQRNSNSSGETISHHTVGSRYDPGRPEDFEEEVDDEDDEFGDEL